MLKKCILVGSVLLMILLTGCGAQEYDSAGFRKELDAIIADQDNYSEDDFATAIKPLMARCKIEEEREYLSDVCLKLFSYEKWVGNLLYQLEAFDKKDEEFLRLLQEKVDKEISFRDRLMFCTEVECGWYFGSGIGNIEERNLDYYHPVIIKKEEIEQYIENNMVSEEDGEITAPPFRIWKEGSENKISIYEVHEDTGYQAYGPKVTILFSGEEVTYKEAPKRYEPTSTYDSSQSNSTSSPGSSRTCPNCNGTGATKTYATNDPLEEGTVISCPMCHGTGKVNN